MQLFINDVLQATGYLDKVSPHADRGGGAEWDLEGRDAMAHVVDGVMDPLTQFKAGMTLADIAEAVFFPFGFNVHVDSEANRDAIKGAIVGTKQAKAGKKTGKSLKGAAVSLLKPHPQEGCFAFFTRIANRHGLMAWSSNDGLNVIVSKPDFDQAPSGILQRTTNGPNNIVSGGTSVDIADQPHLIIAEGFSGAPEFGKSRIRARMRNPVVDTISIADIEKAEAKYKDASEISFEKLGFAPFSLRTARTFQPRIIYLNDPDSHTLAELEHYVLREMSLRMRKSLAGHYTVEGHALPDASGVLGMIAVDTIYSVNDEVSDIDMPLYCLSRTFKKSRGSGTSTDVEMIRPYSIVL